MEGVYVGVKIALKKELNIRNVGKRIMKHRETFETKKVQNESEKTVIFLLRLDEVE